MNEGEGTDNAQRLARLLTVAETEFLANGFAAANVARIAAAAGMSKKTIYKYVASKEALFSEVVRSRLSVPAIAAADTDGLPLNEALARYFNAFCELSFSHAGISSHRLVLSEGARFPELARAYADAVTAYGVKEVAALLQRAGEPLVLADPDLAARMLMAMILAEPMRDTALGVSPAPSLATMRQRAATAIALFLDGARAQPQLRHRPS